ncbi:hypothetical protein [Hyphomonas johnsonii]|uniref:Uncharacterized protein n=1 Tax=Hyphomonas johnsonii MHS-2 TaxID=1280950 RepID=A0A059FTM5_9PROT|nr:hypothetical protein [Hyphomonas johnsonii]KCZ93818.1 hypothetical protein HJO_00540 [Hyphomonas johnsonii MHS-2]
MTARQFTTSEAYEHEGYCPGHPWYYFLGGRPRRPREILEVTRQNGYQGHAREDIKAADGMAEPKRSGTLRAMRDKFKADLARDISRYRECVRQLRKTDWKIPDGSEVVSSGDIHTALSLKHNHMVNNFAHLILLDELLAKQADLFDF